MELKIPHICRECNESKTIIIDTKIWRKYRYKKEFIKVKDVFCEKCGKKMEIYTPLKKDENDNKRKNI